MIELLDKTKNCVNFSSLEEIKTYLKYSENNSDPLDHFSLLFSISKYFEVESFLSSTVFPDLSKLTLQQLLNFAKMLNDFFLSTKNEKVANTIFDLLYQHYHNQAFLYLHSAFLELLDYPAFNSTDLITTLLSYEKPVELLSKYYRYLPEKTRKQIRHFVEQAAEVTLETLSLFKACVNEDDESLFEQILARVKCDKSKVASEQMARRLIAIVDENPGLKATLVFEISYNLKNGDGNSLLNTVVIRVLLERPGSSLDYEIASRLLEDKQLLNIFEERLSKQIDETTEKEIYETVVSLDRNNVLEAIFQAFLICNPKDARSLARIHF